MKRVLVTGGCGFIGSHVIDELLLDPEVSEIINVDKLGIGSKISNVARDEKILNYYVDICSSELGQIISQHRPTHIIHLAAESHVDRSISDPLSFVHSNVFGTNVLLECARTIVPDARIVHVSTDEVYGHLESDGFPFVETTPIAPRSPYSATKAGSDLLALAYRNTYNLNVVVTRCCNNYGPRQHEEKLIPTIIRSLVEGKCVPVYGKGDNIREWIYVKDHAKALVEICFSNHKQEVYNIYGVSRRENKELVELIIEKLTSIDTSYIRESGKYIEYVKDRPGHDFCYKMSTLFNDIKSLTAQKDFLSGIQETILYYKYKYEKEDKTTF